MNYEKLLSDFNIPYIKNNQAWINTKCPFCQDKSKHLGLNTEHGGISCWRCGGHKRAEVISALLRVDEDQARAIIAQYGGKSGAFYRPQARPAVKPVRTVTLPPNTRRLNEVPGAMLYLARRGFDPDELENLWGVRATGPGARVTAGGKTVDYSYRVMVPVHREGRVVTYQGRDWTGKVEKQRKYLAVLPALEAVPIKETLYGLDYAAGRERVVLMEGVTDVWRYGPGAVACFGIKYREPQVRLLLQFEEVVTCFDPDPQARVQAQRIIRELNEHGVLVRRARLPKGKDPADMNREELRRLCNAVY